MGVLFVWGSAAYILWAPCSSVKAVTVYMTMGVDILHTVARREVGIGGAIVNSY